MTRKKERERRRSNLKRAVIQGETVLRMVQVLDGEGGKITRRCKQLFKAVSMRALVRDKELGHISEDVFDERVRGLQQIK